jgi:hypothetical protein
MVAYPRDADPVDDLAYDLARNSFVRLFWRLAVLAETSAWLRARGYQLVEVTCAQWHTAADMLADIAAAFDFPDYFGANLHALNDCLRDVVGYDYGADGQATGTVLVLTQFETFARAEPAAEALLDIFATQARNAALIGHRMLCLVQSDDPHLHTGPLGGTTAPWNPAEWLTSSREPGGSAAQWPLAG